jgi:hypothetical protein
LALKGLKENPEQLLDHCLLEAIRDVSPEGGEKLIGTATICRSFLPKLFQVNAGCPDDEEQGERLLKENNEREAGDPEIIYTIGCQSFQLFPRALNWANPVFKIISLRLTKGGGSCPLLRRLF